MKNILNEKAGTRKAMKQASASVMLICCIFGCAAPDRESEAPIVCKPHYLDDGSTISVDDTFFSENDGSGPSLLERLKNLSEKFDAESEKNALLAQELVNTRDARDRLKEELDATKNRSISLSEEIAALKMSLSSQENSLSMAYREKKDLMEKLVNLQIEKANLEKELLKIKIAAFSDGM